jgi:hypothetical protein
MEVLLLDLIKKEEDESLQPSLRLAVRAYPSDTKGLVSLTPDCETLEVFEHAVAELRKTIDNLVERARETCRQYQVQVEGEKAITMPQSAEEIWENLKECSSIEDMRELFNSLNLDKRQEVADFVLTQLNIFKGAASTFSQHYNEEEYLLE